MGDIWVHLRMKKCCRETLRKIDTEKNRARLQGGLFGVSSLEELLGPKTIDAARAAIPASGSSHVDSWVDAQMERVTRQICSKICEKHTEEHIDNGEFEESAFWNEMIVAFLGEGGSLLKGALDKSRNPGSI
jgi:hypothetical protein